MRQAKNPINYVVACGLAVACLWAGAAPAGAAASVYKVANYPVGATAGDAVAAKEQAMAEGQQGAFRYLLKRLVPVTAYKRLPKLSLSRIEDLIEGVSVRDEQNSSTEYIATLDFNFKSGPIQELLQSYGLAAIDQQAQVLTLLPVYAESEGGRTGLAEGQRLWRQAWSGLDLTNALTPVRIAVPGPSATNEVFLALATGDMQKFGIVAAESSAERLVIALATPSDDGKKLSVQLIGRDWTGDLLLKRTYSIYYEDLSYTSELAAIIALGVLEGRWKSRFGASGGTATAAATPGDWAVSGPQVRLRATYASLEEWQQIRQRLAQTPGIENLQIGQLSARGAEVSFGFAGSIDSLRPTLAAQGLAIEELGGQWLLRLQF